MSIAFFDFDGTLIQRDSGVICAVPSIRRGLLGPSIGARLVATYLLSKVGVRTRTDAQRVGFRCYAGRSLPELRAIMQELYDEHLRGWISPVMREKIDLHRRRGDRLIILTASAFFFAEPIARDLGIDEVIGTQVGFEGGVCTGLVEGAILDGVAKLAAALASGERHGVKLADTTFYSDHIADLP
ncbi:MAG: HAD-IB family hydrolase, partial [Minicystis sp.]